MLDDLFINRLVQCYRLCMSESGLSVMSTSDNTLLNTPVYLHGCRNTLQGSIRRRDRRSGLIQAGKIKIKQKNPKPPVFLRHF